MQTIKPIRWHFALLLGALLVPSSLAATALKINGSTTVNLPVAEAAEILRAGPAHRGGPPRAAARAASRH
jgi:hypothetical protein